MYSQEIFSRSEMLKALEDIFRQTKVSHFLSLSLFTSYFLLLTSYFLLLIFYSLLLTPYSLLLTSDFCLLTSFTVDMTVCVALRVRGLGARGLGFRVQAFGIRE